MNSIQGKNRNFVFDFMRGHFLLAMFFGHMSYYIGNSLFTFYEGNSSLWVSPAEGFVFLAGYFASISAINKSDFKKLLASFWSKAFWMYIVTIVLTIINTLIVVYMGAGPHIGKGHEYSNITRLVTDALLFRYNYSWADILQLYVPLFVVAPIIIVAFKNRLSLIVVGVSALIWLMSFGNLNCPYTCVSFFNVSAWQFLFILGMFFGLHRDWFYNIYDKYKNNLPVISTVFLSFLILAACSTLDYFFHFFPTNLSNQIHIFVNKENLAFGRIFAFFILYINLYIFIQKYSSFLKKYFGWFYGFFGSHSLSTYLVQSVILFGIYYIPLKHGFWLNSLYQVIAITAVFISTKILISANEFRNYKTK